MIYPLTLVLSIPPPMLTLPPTPSQLPNTSTLTQPPHLAVSYHPAQSTPRGKVSLI